jgi:hypothetical protein
MRRRAAERTIPASTWLLPMAVLGTAALLLFTVTLVIDAFGTGAGWRALTGLFDADPDMAWNTLGNLAQTVAAILGIAITVVSIVVELAANRYTPRITDLFIRAPANFAVLGFFLVSCLYCVWISISVRADFIPHVGIAVTVVLLSLSLLLLIPYFAYVFRFLEPQRVIARLGDDAARSLEDVPGADPRTVDGVKSRVVEDVEHLGDIVLNAVGHRDKAIAMEAVASLARILDGHAGAKPRMGETWFAIGPELASNPDFVSMAPEVIEDLSSHRLWLEMKVLRQYQTAFAEALDRQREVNYMIAIHTRRLAERCLAAGDPDALGLSIKFFNTFLRAAINARDVRTGYNIFHQYRLVGEAALRRGDTRTVLDVGRHFAYYGQVAFASGLPFLLETAAYDLCTLNECAAETDVPADLRDALLDLFLEVDKESEGVHEHEESLRGVRKAQVKLATFYLARGRESEARRIQADMEREPDHRLRSIRAELDRVGSRYFWEITDRGLNMDYIAPERRVHLRRFFEWFGGRLDAAEGKEAR